MEASREIWAFTTPQVARIADLTARRVQRWSSDLIRPSGPSGKLYNFRDLVAVRVLAILRTRHHVPLQQLKRAAAFLTARYDAPWTSLRFWVDGNTRELHFKTPGEQMVASATTGQGRLFDYDLEVIVEETAHRAERVRARQARDFGRIEKRRGVKTFAGTRIPVESVLSYLRAGFPDSHILAEYPGLSRDDVSAAREACA